MTPSPYKNKYRIESSRLKNWDYGSNAPYFVTICTRNRENFFGEIFRGEMRLSEIGQEAEKYGQTRFHDHIIRDESAFERIKNYIITNPSNWNKDKFTDNDGLDP